MKFYYLIQMKKEIDGKNRFAYGGLTNLPDVRETLGNAARDNEGATFRVFRLPYRSYREGLYPFGWDAHTFMLTATEVTTRFAGKEG